MKYKELIKLIRTEQVKQELVSQILPKKIKVQKSRKYDLLKLSIKDLRDMVKKNKPKKATEDA